MKISKVLVHSLLLATLIGCQTMVPNSGFQDPELDYYISKAEDYLDIDYNLSVEFAVFEKEEGSTVTRLGTCRHRGTKIYINEETFFDLSEEQKELLILHEIVHCYYDIRHNEDEPVYNTKEGILCPASVMVPGMWSTEQIKYCLDTNEDMYYNQLQEMIGRSI